MMMMMMMMKVTTMVMVRRCRHVLSALTSKHKDLEQLIDDDTARLGRLQARREVFQFSVYCTRSEV